MALWLSEFTLSGYSCHLWLYESLGDNGSFLTLRWSSEENHIWWLRLYNNLKGWDFVWLLCFFFEKFFEFWQLRKPDHNLHMPLGPSFVIWKQGNFWVSTSFKETWYVNPFGNKDQMIVWEIPAPALIAGKWLRISRCGVTDKIQRKQRWTKSGRSSWKHSDMCFGAKHRIRQINQLKKYYWKYFMRQNRDSQLCKITVCFPPKTFTTKPGTYSDPVLTSRWSLSMLLSDSADLGQSP